MSQFSTALADQVGLHGVLEDFIQGGQGDEGLGYELLSQFSAALVDWEAGELVFEYFMVTEGGGEGGNGYTCGC